MRISEIQSRLWGYSCVIPRRTIESICIPEKEEGDTEKDARISLVRKPEICLILSKKNVEKKSEKRNQKITIIAAVSRVSLIEHRDMKSHNLGPNKTNQGSLPRSLHAINTDE